MAGYIPGHIQNVPAAILPAIIAGLARAGICFKATPDDDAGKTWNVEITGY